MFRSLAAFLLLFCEASAVGTHAEHARWLAHNLTYGTISTTSVDSRFPGVAFGNPQSFVDGTLDNATGSLYLYVSSMDASMVDIATNPEVSFTLSQEMTSDAGHGCMGHDLDPEDPMCVRVVMIGAMKNVSAATAAWAKDALFERHPGMKSWPDDHSFYVITLDLKAVWLLDGFGGAIELTASEYFAAVPVGPAPLTNSTPLPAPGKQPFFTEHAKTARWIAHNLGYGVLSTTSTNPQYTGVAFGNPQSFVDGTTDDSTGHLWFYTTPLDSSSLDLAKDPKCSWTLSEQMLGNFCTKKGWDPEDPRCARLVFVGSMRNATTAEIPDAKNALFARHPEMKEWPGDHSFQVTTMDISNIWLIDMFGGASSVDPKDYYSSKP